MNHSQAVLCLNAVKAQIRNLQEDIKWVKRIASEDWVRATKATEEGQQAFYWLNNTRDTLAKLKRKLRALETLSYQLKHMAGDANRFAGWAVRAEADEFDEVITDEDYHQAP